MSLKILECTLRDGGYYNNWDFDKNLVDSYFKAVSLAKINIVEVGFRYLERNTQLGLFAYSKDDFLDQLHLPISTDISVMVDAKEIIDYDRGVEFAVEILFSEKSKSVVDIVRIATNLDNVTQCESIAIKLKALGYRVFLNLMQIDQIGKDNLRLVAEEIQKWDCIEVLYFADSFGNMSTDLIRNVIDTIKLEWSGEIGIHAHDNKGHALINSLSAIDLGVNYVDATILGMGRGAGNVKMENLLVEVVDRNLGKYNPDAIFPLALKEFAQLKKIYKWGSSIYYYLSAVHGIHPTYIQEMLGDERYDVNQILSAIKFLKEKISISYSLDNMLEALSSSVGDEHGEWSAKGWVKGRDVLIIGSGSSTKTYANEISEYIKSNQPIVLCLNINQNIFQDLITAYIACHETRIAIELDLYTDLKKPIILPMGKMPIEVKDLLLNTNIFDYGLKIVENDFMIYDNGCSLNKPLVLIYALCLLSVSGAEKVFLTGIDGYKDNNPKQQEIIMALNQFIKSNSHLELCSITPTTYPIKEMLIV